MAEAQRKGRAYTGRFIERLALTPDERGVIMRAQVERCAARIPPEKRARILTPITAPADHAPAALNQLLLAATLEDLGWTVEHEPEIDGKTPDFRISKRGSEYLVEVASYREKDPDAPQVARIREAFAGMKTLRPIGIRYAYVDGSASLKGFVDRVMSLNSTGKCRRKKRF